MTALFLDRRALLRLGACAALSSSLPTAWGADAPSVRFLTAAEGVAALTTGAGTAYYDRLGLLESRARVSQSLDGLTLADARRSVREFDAAAVLSFSDEECTALRGIVDRLQPLLAARAPLYARTPWSFVKLADRAEGGMPHTRREHIVIPASVAALLAKRHRDLLAAGTLATATFGGSLLVHEQTHVLERADPVRFEPLFTQVFGFVRMTPPPSTPWLDRHEVENPDGPDVVWAFPLELVGGTGFVMPAVTLPDAAQPRMPQDFQAIAVDVRQTDAGWQVIERDGRPVVRDLTSVAGYDTHFPYPDEDFHPDEIAAVALSHWILRDPPDVDARPLMAGVAGWARTALA